MPQPNKNETKQKWMTRCMSDEESNKTFPDAKQRYAVCLSKWNAHEKKQKEMTEYASKYINTKIVSKEVKQITFNDEKDIDNALKGQLVAKIWIAYNTLYWI